MKFVFLFLLFFAVPGMAEEASDSQESEQNLLDLQGSCEQAGYEEKRCECMVEKINASSAVRISTKVNLAERFTVDVNQATNTPKGSAMDKEIVSLINIFSGCK